MTSPSFSGIFLITVFRAVVAFGTNTRSAGSQPITENEPAHDKTNKMTCAPSKNSESDQSSLCTLWEAKDLRTFRQTAKTDQTGHMPRLI